MASGSTSAVPGSVYEKYTTVEVLSMMEDLNEPMCENSEDEPGLDLNDFEDGEGRCAHIIITIIIIIILVKCMTKIINNAINMTSIRSEQDALELAALETS